jgi:hypothetical protein
VALGAAALAVLGPGLAYGQEEQAEEPPARPAGVETSQADQAPEAIATAQQPAPPPPAQRPEAEEPDKENKGVFSLILENDSLSSGADRNYTSGIKFAYVRPTDDIPGWLSPGAALITKTTGARPEFWGVALGQSIFTPVDIQANPAPPDQHPYAGWLYMQFLLGTIQNRDDGFFPRYADLYELEIGMVGPSAMGRQAQRGIHQILGAPDPQGWDSQLEDEFAFAVSYERRWSSLRYFTDMVPGGLEGVLSPNVGATLGTLRTEARAGLTAQIGYRILNAYEIGPPRVRPALSGAGYFDHEPFSWSIFAGFQARGVARNLFLDGNTYRDSASVEKKEFVVDGQAGVTLQFGDFRLAYTYVTRTEEFETQTEPQDFGTIALQVRF